MAGLSFDSRSSNSAFLSAGIFSADSIAALVFSMCSSVIHALLLTLYDLSHVGMGRAWKQPAISEILAAFLTVGDGYPHAVEFTNETKNGLRAGRLQNSPSTPSTRSFSILFSARAGLPGH